MPRKMMGCSLRPVRRGRDPKPKCLDCITLRTALAQRDRELERAHKWAAFQAPALSKSFRRAVLREHEEGKEQR